MYWYDHLCRREMQDVVDYRAIKIMLCPST